MAFAQAVLETGGFSSPDAVDLNNYAGIGHCDTCGQGWAFPSPQAGVLGQLQLLRHLRRWRDRSKAGPATGPAGAHACQSRAPGLLSDLGIVDGRLGERPDLWNPDPHDVRADAGAGNDQPAPHAGHLTFCLARTCRSRPRRGLQCRDRACRGRCYRAGRHGRGLRRTRRRDAPGDRRACRLPLAPPRPGAAGLLPAAWTDAGGYVGCGHHDGEPSLRPLVQVHPDMGPAQVVIGRHAHPWWAWTARGRSGCSTAWPTQHAGRHASTTTRGSPDAVVWDDRRLMHRAMAYDMTQPLRRVAHAHRRGSDTELAATSA